MKKIIEIFTVIVIFLFTSCDEQGIPGPPGMDGVSFLGKVFEIEGDFNYQNNYQLYFEFPGNFEIYNTDIVLTYILWDQYESNGGQLVDIWRPLPQTVVLNEGILQYNFDYTLYDVQIFLDGDIDFSTLLPAEKDNQIFRIVVFPAEFAEDNSFDINNLNEVMNFIGVNSNSVITDF